MAKIIIDKTSFIYEDSRRIRIELVNVADSERYFVTGGANARPSYQALSRIIIAPLPEDLSHREIRYNRENDILKSLASNESLKDKLHYSITANENEYEVSY